MERVEQRLRTSALGEPARRLTRLLAYRAAHYAGLRSATLLELIARLADRLRADGVPVRGSGTSVSDLDVWDLLAAERIPFEHPQARYFGLSAWFDDQEAGRRPLSALAEHPAFRDAFGRDCLDELGSHLFGAVRGRPLHPNLLALARSAPGVAAALEAEVDAVTARLGAEPGAAMSTALHRLEPLRSAAGYAAFGPFLDRVTALDTDASLARTLRGGLPEELAWPEFEAAVSALDPQETRIERQWPLLAVHDARTAVVFNAAGPVARYELRVPARPGLPGRFAARCTLHAGRLLVSWMDEEGERGYWADEPGPDFALDDAGIDLDGLMIGSVTRLPARDDHVVPGGRFLPVPDGGPVRRRWRRTLPEGAPAPFGAASGETGWDVVDGPSGPAVRAVDGRQVPLPPAAWPAGIAGVLQLPGTDRLLTVDPFEEMTLWDPETATPGWRSSRPAPLPPIGWWDRMRPRDPAGSAALRAGDPAGVNDPVLRAAVEREATAAAELARSIAGFRALPEEPAPAAVSAHAHDHNIRNGLFGLIAPYGRIREELITQPRPTSGYGTLDYLATLPAVLAGSSTAQQRHLRRWSPRVPGWTQVLPGLGAVALRAGLATTPAPERAALAALLAVIADAGLADDAAGLTLVTVVSHGEQMPDPAADFGHPADVADGIASGFGRCCNRIVVVGIMPAHDRYRVVERVPLGGWGDAATVRRFVTLLDERGPVAWRPQWVPAAVAAGLDLPDDAAEVLLTGARNIGPLNPRKGEQRAAPAAVTDLRPERLLQLLNAAMPTDPELLWATGPDVAALAEAWRSAPPQPPYKFEPWLED